MKFWTSEHTFSHPWEKVVQAAWRKYPNPMNPSVTAIDVLDRRIDDQGVMHTQRLLSSGTNRWGIPQWVQSIVGSPNVMYANEHSSVDPRRQTMVLKSRNITFCNFIAVDEQLVYSIHPENPRYTLLRQEAVVLVQGVPLGSYMESMLTNTISSNATKGRLAIEWVIQKINDEIKDLSTSAVSAFESTDEFINSTKKSIDDIAHKVSDTAKKSMDDLSSAAKKSLDEFLPTSAPQTPPPMPLPKF